jgi:peptide/nickel transport system permease protein
LFAFVVRRSIAMVVMLFLLSIVTFLMFSVVPADPAALTCGKSCSPQVIEANRVRMGLDKPLVEQYTAFVGGIFTGRTFGSGTQTFECSAPCLGYSFKEGEEVRTLIVEALPPTVSLAIGAFILWMVVGVLLGVYAALRRGRWQDRTAMGFALVGYSFPSFFLGYILLYFFVFKFAILPFPKWIPLSENPSEWFVGLILPWATLAMLYAAYYVRLTRNQMLETLGEDYIRTARSKGLPERNVIYKHGLRAGLTPLVTSAGLDLAGLLGGAIIVESVFGIPGLGRLAITSVLDSDLSVIVAIVLLTASFIIVANLVVDILYAVIDPRVRIG